MKWLTRLEYKFGSKYIRNLIAIIIAGQAAVFIASVLMPQLNLYYHLGLVRENVLQGQVWRLVTFVFLPPAASAWRVFITLYCYWLIGRAVESAWGPFRLNCYYLVGILGAWLSMFIFGAGSNYYLNLSLLLAFATLVPDATIMLFFILPIKSKWLGLAYAAILVLDLIPMYRLYVPLGLTYTGMVACSLIAYLIFFGPTLVSRLREEIRVRRNRQQWKNNWK